MPDNQLAAILFHEHLHSVLHAGIHGVWELDCVTGQLAWGEQAPEIPDPAAQDMKVGPRDEKPKVRPEDLPDFRTHLDEFLKGRRTQYSEQFRITPPAARPRHVAVQGYVFRDPESRPLRVIGFLYDFTEADTLRESLRVAEERWKLALSSNNDAVWDWNLAEGEVFRDARYAEILGYVPGELLSEERIWRTLGHPDDIPLIESSMEEHAAGRTPLYQCEYRMRHKQGHWVWILGRGKIVARDEQNRALRMVGTLTDITSHKLLEERLRHSEEMSFQLSRLAQIGAWEWDIATGRLTWSPEMFRIHEVDLGFEPTLPKALDFYPPLASQTLQEAINHSVHSGTSFDFELPLVTAQRRNLVVRIQGRAETEAGRTIRLHGAIQDITDRSTADSMRRKLEAQLFQAQKMETLGTLAGGIAHDFNNLLTGILGYQELALETLTEDHSARSCLAAAREASLRARELVDQILTFSRQSGAERVPVNIRQLVEDARRFLRATVPTSIGIEVEVSPECSQILADATQIHQVLLNLGSNAAHAMRATGGTIRLALSEVEIGEAAAPPLNNLAPGQYLRLVFSDNGHGMDDATRKRIFDPFFTTKEVGQGTGLGLSVVHGIIDSHRGAITVESTPNQGTTFLVYLPVAEPSSIAHGEESASTPQGHGELIAVLDDDATICRIVQMTLIRAGYRTRLFSSPIDCLNAMRSNPSDYALLLTDQTMPLMKGVELAAEIRTYSAKMPIVIMSGYFSRISPEKLAQIGRVCLLPKPFTNTELTNVIGQSIK
jgi:PAS domain S-box-containing protein